MAKYTFMQSQFDEISRLLKKRLIQNKDEQKRTRAKIRKLGFRISDYFHGFDDKDFKRLLENGIIKIVDEQGNRNVPLNRERIGVSESFVKDENYVLDLCDDILNRTASRQHKFDFLKGDMNEKGHAVKLPVDGYYPDLSLVIEYHERQHTEEVPFFDKVNKMTVSGVSRGVQRKIYDQRRRDVLPKYNIHLIEISYADFDH